MKKSLSCFLLIAVMFVVSGFYGCSPKVEKGEGALFEANYHFSITASSNEDSIELDIKDDGDSFFEDGFVLDVVMLKPYEYYKGEEDRGVTYQSTEYDEGVIVGTYTVGENSTLSVNRVSDTTGYYDNLYCKSILASEGELVAGPFSVSNIDSERDFKQKIVVDSKKGILNQGNDMVLDLGCSWTEYNVMINTLVYPNEYVDGNGEVVSIDNSGLSSEEAIRFTSNGKTYYFRKSEINTIDNNLLFCKENNIKAVLILYSTRISDQFYSPYFMTYPAVRDYTRGHLWATDTSTELGAGYFTAVMEFLAERYSREDGEFGYAHRFVIGNEIDISWDWNPVVNYDTTEALPLTQYVEEYARLLRIAEQATKKYYSDSMVLVSTCHYWAGYRTGVGAYGSKQIYDYLNAKISYQGNYNWGMASHPYPIDLTDATFLTTESRSPAISGDEEETIYITWTNLELLDLYLAKEEYLFNGEMRRVYLTEGGVSSGHYSSPRYEQNLLNQAAGVAYAYYKSVTLDCVDAFIYYKAVDSEADGGGCNFGVVKDNGEIKPSYDVLKYIDTQYSFVVANQYLAQLKFRYDGKTHSVSNGKITSYKDTMRIFDSKFDFDKMWSIDKIITREIATVPELEELLNEN